ncbi:MAG: hypothetical protein P4L69_18760 [Desulfosporosinus sp.]|nr:hypothetical protein [Desulfosporosinus sp.]
MKKKQHTFFAWVLVILIIIAMVASGGAMFFSGGGVPSTNSNATTQAANPVADYQATKARLEAMVKQAKLDPGNIPLQTALGNEYYNAGAEAETVAIAETKENYKHAVEAYQNVLKTNKDINVMVDMATAAFKSGDNDLAEKSFNEALAIKPDFINALINYGIFLSEAKQDWTGALNQWQKALPLAQNSSDKAQIQAMISEAQSQIKASSNNGTSNPATNGMSNPTLKTGK